MKKLLLLPIILFLFSCGSDIGPDAQKVCALMEDQLDYLEEALDRNDRQIMAINLMNYKTINDEIVLIKSKYGEAEFDEELYSICADGEGEILELVNIVEDELLYLDVKEVCELQGINYRRFMDYFDSDQYYYDGTISAFSGLSTDEMEEGIRMYEDYTSQINQIKSGYNEYLFEDRLADFCNERDGGKYGPLIDYSVLSEFYEILKAKLESTSSSASADSKKVTKSEADAFMSQRMIDTDQTLMKTKVREFQGSTLYLYMSVTENGMTCISSVSEHALEVLAADCGETYRKIEEWNAF